jgi:hypothetical protein
VDGEEVIGASSWRHKRGQLQLQKVLVLRCLEAAAGVRGGKPVKRAAELPGRQDCRRKLHQGVAGGAETTVSSAETVREQRGEVWLLVACRK